jgi:hypothetical protein
MSISIKASFTITGWEPFTEEGDEIADMGYATRTEVVRRMAMSSPDRAPAISRA